MEINYVIDGIESGGGNVTRPETFAGVVSREQLIQKINQAVGIAGVDVPLRGLCDYVGASHYLLARYDLLQEKGLDFIVTSNWPFDLVRRVGSLLAEGYSRSTEIEKCLALLQPQFESLPDDCMPPAGLSRRYCILFFSVGRARFALLLLFPEELILSQERLREAALLAAYAASSFEERQRASNRDFDLTERELECLFWIAEGKTSDEIALILGISRNTINNYITSVMRKTATKTRSEAIAYVVRNNLV